MWVLSRHTESLPLFSAEKGTSGSGELAAHFPTCSGLDVLQHIGRQHPWVKAVMLSAIPDLGLMAAAIEGRAAGFISRDCHIVDIVRALARVRHGERVFDGAPPEAVRVFRLPGA